jgi:hypothetical protein
MPFDRARNRGPAAAGLLVLAASTFAVLGSAAPVAADETSNPLNSMLGLLGAKPEPEADAIDYRPRAPLVVPPSRDLPEPKEAARDPAWPKDADANARRRASLDSRRPAPGAATGTNAAPEPKSTQVNAAAPAGSDASEAGCFLNATGPQSCFNSLQAVFGGGGSSEPAKPGVEPTRKLLTEPPSGYRASMIVPTSEDRKSSSGAQPQGPFDSFLKVFGMKNSDDQ